MNCNGTTVEYNSVVIHDVLTDSVDQEVVYDPTGVDPIGIRVRVQITGYVHLAAQEGLGVQMTGDLAGAMRAVQDALLTPRRTFTMKLGEQIWLSCSPYLAERCVAYSPPSSSAQWDIEHGPRPTLRVLAIYGQHAIKISFGITYTKSICQDPAAAYLFRGLMNLRLWISDDIDCSDWTVTRTYQGVLRFYGSVPFANNEVVHPNQIARAFAIPPLQWGFQRKRISINQDPNGLSATFSVTDKEVWAVAPAPATDWEGNFEVRTPYGGITCESECQVTVRGGKMTPKWHLVRLVMQILNAKLSLLKVPQNYIVMGMGLSEPLNRNEVSGYAKIKHMGEGSLAEPLTLGAFKANSNTWFKPFPSQGPGSLNVAGLAPGTHAPYHPEHGYQGSCPDGANTVLYAPNSIVGLLLPALQTPCCPVWLTNHEAGYEPYPPGYMGSDYPPDSGTEIQTGSSPTPPENDTDRYDVAHKEHFYWNCKLTSEYQTKTGLAAFPRAAPDANQATLSMVRMHAPCQFREIRMEFFRTVEWPQLPKPAEKWTDDWGIDHYLLDWKLAPNAASMAADHKTDIRSCLMILHYALSRPVDWEKGEGFAVGRLPNRRPDDRGFQELPMAVANQIFVDPENIIGVVVSSPSPPQ